MVMIKRFLISIYLFSCFLLLEGQVTTIISTPQTLTADSYTRNPLGIILKPGFQYGANSGSPSLFNLSTSSYPSYVNSSYVAFGSNCEVGNQLPNNVVGEVQGSFAVSPTGAALYTIPIYVPSGTKGVQPDLSVGYNSNLRSGIMGVGWRLNGLSSITRVSKNPYLDGKFDAVQLTSTDVFAIDGNRLLLKAGVYGGVNSQYVTESETFSKITAGNSLQGNGPNSFQVITKNGTILSYGSNVNSRLASFTGATVLTWYLDKVTDEFGNYMTYTYKALNGEVVIDKIDYTGNSTILAPYNSVKFEYTDIAEKNTYYVADWAFKNTQLLKSISSLSGTDVVKKYVFDYKFDKGTLLSSVTEINADGSQLNPTTFCWSDPFFQSSAPSQAGTSLFTAVSEFNGLDRVVTADLDGNGFGDALCIYMGSKTLQTKINNYAYANISTPSLSFNSQIYSAHPSLMASDKLIESFVLDTDNDGKQEIYNIYSHGSQILYIISKVTDAGPQTYTMSPNLTNTYDPSAKPTRFYYDVNDYTGDGVNDEVIIDPEKITVNSSQGNIVFNLPLANPTLAKPLDFNGDGVLDFIVMEAIGNTLVNAKIYTYTNTGTAQLQFLCSGNFFFPGNTTGNLLMNFGLGDFNGDAKTDIAVIDETKSNLYVSYSTGLNIFPAKKVNAFTPISPNNIDYNIGCPDVNSDGISDIIITNDIDNSGAGAGSTTDNYFSYFPIGDEFVKGPSAQGNWTYVENYVLKYYPKAFVNSNISSYIIRADIPVRTHNFDLNGDGNFDVISLSSVGATAGNLGNLQHQKILLNDLSKTKASYVYKITTGMGNVMQLDYSNTNTGFNKDKYFVYTKASSTPYNLPLVNYKPSMFVVSKVVSYSAFYVPNTPAISNVYHYAYTDAIYHKGGRGFLGFEQVIKVHHNTGAVSINTKLGSITKNTFDVNRFIPLNTENLSALFSVQLSGTLSMFVISSITQKATIQYLISPSTVPKGFFIAPSLITNKDYLSTVGKETSIVYDLSKDGNVSSVNTNSKWTSGSPVRGESASFSYGLVGTVNPIWKKVAVNTSSQQGSDPAYTRLTNVYYDAQGNINSISKDPNLSGQNLIINVTSNSFGQPTQIQIPSAGTGFLPRSNSYLYDPTGRFIVKSINGLSYTEEYVYEPKFGNITQYKDITGLVTNYQYDGQGRLLQTQLPTGAINKIGYNLIKPAYQPSTQNGVFSVTYQNEAEPKVIRYFDEAGRLMRTEQEAFNNVTTYSDNNYNELGWISKSSESHAANQASYIVSTYLYNETYSRLSQVNTSNASGTLLYADGYSYNATSTDGLPNPGFLLHSTRGNYSVRKYLNYAGQTATVQTIAGPLQNSLYTYHSNGQPSKIELSYGTDPVTVTHNFNYNSIGQQTQLVDPSAGTIDYEYNLLGELTKQTDALGQFTFDYDGIGRLLNKNDITSGTTYNYQYISSGNGLGQVQKIIGPNTTTEYKYDNLNQTTEYKETHTGNKIFKSNYTYDKYGRLDEYTYPSGFTTKNIYDGLGYLTKINNVGNNSLIWQADNYNSVDQITQFTYGNGLQTANTFDVLHQLTKTDFGTLHSQQYVYGNSANGNDGNIYKRNFIKNPSTPTPPNLQDVFDYDQNRLTQADLQDPYMINPPVTNTILFDPNGNITKKSDAGDYVYSQANKPFTLTNINNATNNISLNTLGVNYNSFRKVKQISEGTTNKQMDFTYGNFDERIKVDYSVSGVNQYSRYYCDNYDREETTTTTKEWTYIYAPTGLAAVYYNNNGNKNLLYATIDHLGSPIMLTNATQAIVEEYNFDAWGRRRDPATGYYTLSSQPQYLKRGYTMHEHIDEFGLINMNGRVYDPVLGRFIQPDNIVQNPENVQTFNRYSYVMNNPLKYTDPSGWGGEGGDGFINPSPGISAQYENSEAQATDNSVWNQWGGGWMGGGGGGGGGFSGGGSQGYTVNQYNINTYTGYYYTSGLMTNFGWTPFTTPLYLAEAIPSSGGGPGNGWSMPPSQFGSFGSGGSNSSYSFGGGGRSGGRDNGSGGGGNQGTAANSTYNNISNDVGAFGIGWSTKEVMLQGAVAEARGISMSSANNISNIRALGATGAGYMNVVKQVSRGTVVLGAAMTISDGVSNGFKAHHAADLGIQAAIYGLSATVPVAGWIIGGAYFLGDMYFQSTHNGRSMTQYYLDVKK